MPDRWTDEQLTLTRIAYHIDKCCTGGTDEDWEAARMIVDDLVEGRIQGPWSEAEAERGPLREVVNLTIGWLDSLVTLLEKPLPPGFHVNVGGTAKEAARYRDRLRAALSPSSPCESAGKADGEAA
jgi:hypothetical protein